MKKRKIIAVTGARSEYDILYPVLALVQEDPQMELAVVVTGAHLSEKYGKTVSRVEADGFRICDKLYNLVDTDERIGRVISLGNQVSLLAHAFDREKPDIVFMAGDREEAITTSLTGAYMDIPVAHLAGGDIAKDGNIDNSTRYAASKYAHIHFTILPEHKNTLLKLGEDEWRIFVTGNPALDRFVDTPLLDRKYISEHLDFDITGDPYLVLIQHPIISEVEESGDIIRETLDAIVESGMKCLINFPNSDAGNHSMISMYETYAARHPQLYLFRNLPRDVYINILRNASCLLGNSSSGIIEAPSIGLPVINIGKRQRGRTHAANVIFTDNDKTQILQAIQKSVNDAEYRESMKHISNPYGDGKSAQKIKDVLKNIEITPELIYKNITYTL